MDQLAKLNFANIAQEYAFPLTYTYSYSKYSCVAPMYAIHIAMNYFLILVGILAMASRIIPRFHWLHVWFGRAYILGIAYTHSILYC